MIGELYARSTVGLLAALVVTAGCSSPLSDYHCDESTDCGVDGRCEPSGWCSAPDSQCPSGWRYTERSGELSASCTPAAPDAGADAATVDASSPDAGGPDAALLSCHPGFAFEPTPPVVGQMIDVRYTDQDTPWAFVGIEIDGPGEAMTSGVDAIDSGGPWTWRWFVTFDTPGVWSLAFTATEETTVIAECDVQVEAAP